MRRVWLDLSLVYLRRTRRAVGFTAAAAAVIIALIARKSGYSLQSIVEPAIGAALMLPLALSGVIVKSRTDGSFRFLATLPVSQDEHAMSWLAACVALSAPVITCLILVFVAQPLAMSGLSLLLSVGLGAALVVSASFTLLAFQMRARPGEAASMFVLALAGILVALQVAGSVASRFGLSFPRLVSSHGTLVLATTVVWCAAAASGLWAWKTIGRTLAHPPASILSE